MKLLIPFLLIVAAIAAYFILSTQFGFYQRYPIIHFVLAAAGVVWLGKLMFEHFTVWRLLLTSVGVFLIAGFTWYTLSYSTYQQQAPRVQKGDRLGDALSKIVVKTSEGKDFPFMDALKQSKATLLVLYRGVW